MLFSVGPAGLGLGGCAWSRGPGAAGTAPPTAPPQVVHDRFEALGAGAFPGIRLGADRLSAAQSSLGLDRFNQRRATWGPDHRPFHVVQVTSTRAEGMTALVLQSDEEDAVVASILVRDFAGAPPASRHLPDFLPWLERFGSAFDVYDVPPLAPGAPDRDRYAVVRREGLKVGFIRGADGRWSLDNVEFFPRSWSAHALARLKRLPGLRKVGVLRPGAPFRDPREAEPGTMPRSEPANPPAGSGTP